jgi:hypothetical protein
MSIASISDDITNNAKKAVKQSANNQKAKADAKKKSAQTPVN